MVGLVCCLFGVYLCVGGCCLVLAMIGVDYDIPLWTVLCVKFVDCCCGWLFCFVLFGFWWVVWIVVFDWCSLFDYCLWFSLCLSFLGVLGCVYLIRFCFLCFVCFEIHYDLGTWLRWICFVLFVLLRLSSV